MFIFILKDKINSRRKIDFILKRLVVFDLVTGMICISLLLLSDIASFSCKISSVSFIQIVES
jgi:hypothetical protein